jgi:hypothetical protein
MAIFPQPQYMPCNNCGASVARSEAEGHVCEPERKLDFEVFQLREELEAFEAELGSFLETPRGRFEAWIAERDRRRSD